MIVELEKLSYLAEKKGRPPMVVMEWSERAYRKNGKYGPVKRRCAAVPVWVLKKVKLNEDVRNVPPYNIRLEGVSLVDA